MLFQAPKHLHFELLTQLGDDRLFLVIGISVLGKEKRDYFRGKSIEITVGHLKGHS